MVIIFFSALSSVFSSVAHWPHLIQSHCMHFFRLYIVGEQEIRFWEDKITCRAQMTQPKKKKRNVKRFLLLLWIWKKLWRKEQFFCYILYMTWLLNWQEYNINYSIQLFISSIQWTPKRSHNGQNKNDHFTKMMLFRLWICWKVKGYY